MKKFLLLFVILISSVGINFAQNGGQRQRTSPEERQKQMVEQLGLDKAQEAKLTAINAKYSDQLGEIRKEMRGADDAKRQELMPKMRELMTSENKEIRAILTADQAKKFDEMQKQREERMKSRGTRSSGQRGGKTRPGK